MTATTWRMLERLSSVRYPGVMVGAAREAVQELASRVRARFGTRTREVRLFGSHARGDAHEESDVDVLIVVDDLTESERRNVFDMAYEIDAGAPDWVGLSPLPYATHQASELRARERRLLRDIDSEGVAF